MRHVCAILTLIAICGCSQQPAEHPHTPPDDSEIRRNIVGTWIVDEPLSRGGSIKGTVTIDADGSFASEATIVLEQRQEHVSIEGTWQVKDGALIETVTKSNTEIVDVGRVTSDKIIRVDDNELVYQTENGDSVTRKRSK